MKKYSFPVLIEIEMSEEPSREEAHLIREKVQANLDYVLRDMDFIVDSVQEATNFEVGSIRVKGFYLP